MIRCLAITAASLACASGAHAGFFSFASDVNHDGPTLQGLGLQVRDGGTASLDGTVQVLFRYDADEDGPGAAIDIPARLELNATLRDYARPAFAGLSIHSYLASGGYSFFSLATNQLILRVEFSKATFTSVSTAENTWGNTANLAGDQSVDLALAFIAGPALGGGLFNEKKNFDFTLTALRTAEVGNPVVISTSSGETRDRWIAESSWSARAVPAPASLGLAGLAGTLAARRRRR